MKLKKENSLRIIKTTKEMQAISLRIKNKGINKIFVIPTMGALHDGHLSLIKKAKKKNIVTVVTIFVNPKQFNDKKDLNKYPANLKSDIKKLRNIGVDFLFVPKNHEIYPSNFQTKVVVEELQNHLCGISRKGHFDGVTSVVLKIFNIIQPDYSIFGEKDLQQLIIIKRMVKDLNIPIKILSHKIIREKDGLALSSRNIRLTKKNREIAPIIFKGLKKAKEDYKKNNLSSINIIKNLRKYYLVNNINDIQYIEIINPENITYPIKPKSGDYLLVAVKLGSIRLIDNLKF
tara:strand:+ start:55075 stop:55941 length:867 start_codon:yes stop_codon:yes gene_type:complete